MKISRQSEHYGGTQEALDQHIKAEAYYRAASSFAMPHLLDSPGIGRIGDDPLDCE